MPFIYGYDVGKIMSGSEGRVVRVYLFLQDTMADWETGYVIAELASGRFFREGAPEIVFRTVGETGDPVRTMGGLTIVPDISVSDMCVSEDTVVILPGSDRWQTLSSSPIMDKVETVLSAGGRVGAFPYGNAPLDEPCVRVSPHTALAIIHPVTGGNNRWKC